MLPTDYVPADERDLEIFAATVPDDHYLRKVKSLISFERCRDELLSTYCTALGRPAKEPILLLKLEDKLTNIQLPMGAPRTGSTWHFRARRVVISSIPPTNRITALVADPGSISGTDLTEGVTTPVTTPVSLMP